MWSRKELKNRAKAVLRKNYWHAFLISIVIAFAGGASGCGGGSGGSSHSESSQHSTYSNIHNDSFMNWHLILIVLIIFIIVILASLTLRIFIGYSLETGGRRYFIQSAQYQNNKKCLSFGFNGHNYIGIVKTMLLSKIYIFLWSLLLIIPGIVKSYAYRMVPYILADNPNIGVKKAIAISDEMTMGHKLNIFVLDLSFIGWYLLGALALGIGILFVMPYANAANAELYLVLRKDALNNALCTYEDLLLTNPVSANNNDMW